MLFKKKKRKITTGASPGDKFVAQLDRGVKVNTEQLAEMMVTSSTVTKGDMLNSIDSLITQMYYVLQLGHSVKLRGFGTFYVKTKVKAVNTADEVTADTIERITIGFIPDVEVRDRMKKVSITVESEEGASPTP
ncbi:MAG: bacterial DNA-binding protein [Bacteroidetes bacterium]|nr:bacterial DNA-binding protein [Bacteroidota bacterium]